MGCGVVAGYGHLPAITQTDGLTLHALFDPNQENLRAAADRFGRPAAFDAVDAFFRSGIDAVVVTSPAPVHLANVLAAARHRLPVLCEKPLAMNDDEARQMIAAMDAAHRPLYVGFTYRFSPAALQIRQMIRDGVIGRVVDLRLIYLWDLHGKYLVRDGTSTDIHPRYLGRMLEGGPIVDCGVHQIDLARWWLDSEVARQHAVGVWVDQYDAPDHVYLHLDHASGAHTLVEISYTYGHTARSARAQFKYELIGTDGVILYDREAERFEVRTAAGVEALPFSHEKNFHGMYEAFRDALRTGKSDLLATGRDGRINTQIATQAVQQAVAARGR
jgi:predicted dehydrogenase